jgi:short-subunit dehydrogenase
MHLALTGRDRNALERVAAGLSEAGDPTPSGPTAPTVVLPADLTLPGVAATVVEGAVAGLGGLDVVVSNAGAGWAGPMVDMTAEDIDALIDLNLRAPAHLARAALPHLLDKGRGHLVFVGSIAGHLGVPREVVYSATKAGLVGLTDALRDELRGTGVKVTLVSPGVVDTAFFDRRNRPYEREKPRPVPAADVAGAVVDCLEHGRPDAVVPRWLSLPVRIHGAAPHLYRSLAARFA